MFAGGGGEASPLHPPVDEILESSITLYDKSSYALSTLVCYNNNI